MKKIIVLALSFTLIFSLAACAAGATNATTPSVKIQTTPAAATSTVFQATKTIQSTATASPKVQTTSSDSSRKVAATDNKAAINLGKTSTVTGSGAEVAGNTVKITAAGTYTLSGTLSDGQIVVDTNAPERVTLVLNGVDIRSTTSSAIYIMQAEEVVIELAEGTKNVVSDAAKYIFATAGADEPNAAIFSKADLKIDGAGSLTVNGNYNDGIASKDDLDIKNGTLTVSAVDDGIRGKDSVEIKGGTITVNAKGDGVKADNEEDTSKGFVSIESGQLTIVSGADAIEAVNSVTITGGEITITSGGGSASANRSSTATSAKAIKGINLVQIDGGTLNLNSADDAVHSNKSIVINGGVFNISTGDDGMHADGTLEINDGDIKIVKSYEGLESAVITINNGTIHVVSSDDGINVAGGLDSSGANQTAQQPGRNAGPGQDAFASGSRYLYIHGGYIAVEANGDGIDINGGVEMTNGVLLVNGPVANNNSALDYDRGFKMTGGTVIAAGSSGMAQAPDTTSTVYSVLVNLTSTQKAGTLFNVQDDKGNTLFTFAPTKTYQSVAFAMPQLVKGAAYNIYLGGSSTGTVTDSLYQNGAYSSGTKNTSFTISSIVTRIGQSRMR